MNESGGGRNGLDESNRRHEVHGAAAEPEMSPRHGASANREVHLANPTVKRALVAAALIAVPMVFGLAGRGRIARAQDQAAPSQNAEKPTTSSAPQQSQPAQPAQPAPPNPSAQSAPATPEGDNSDHPVAPVFSLTTLDGKKFNLADYKGKVVLLDFWATWCGPCRIEIPGFVEMQDRYASAGFSVVGIDMDDDPAAVPEFARQFRMNYPVAVGDARVSELYGGVYGLPTAFLIGRDGRVYAKLQGAFPVGVFDREVRALLAVKETEVPTGFDQKIDLGDPDAVNSEVPGINLTKLTAEQKDAYKKQLEKGFCTCGCNRNLLDCRINDRGCGVSLKAAREQLRKFLAAQKQ